MQLLINEDFLSDSYADRRVGQQEKYYIEDIIFQVNGSISYWKVLYHKYDGTDLQNSQGTEYGDGWHKNVAKDPVEAAPNWASPASLFTNRFMPLNVSQYLTELVIAIGMDNITSSGSALTYNNTINGKNHTKVLTYNDNGIRDTYSRYYNRSLAYKYELVYYGEPYNDWLPLLILLVVFVVIVLVGSFCNYIFYSRKKLKTAKKR